MTVIIMKMELNIKLELQEVGEITGREEGG
jgi:hypothetical protein